MKRMLETYRRFAVPITAAILAGVATCAASEYPPDPNAYTVVGSTDTFGSWAHAFQMDFVTIGRPGHPVDSTTGHGLVFHEYRIGKYEVSRAMIDAYNALGGGPVIPGRSWNDLPNKPAEVSWNEAARFVNWLNTSTGHAPAYKFTTAGANDNIALWEPGDPGYDPTNLFRNSQAFYYLPSLDEWHKAAYLDPYANLGTGRWWKYATGSNERIFVAEGTEPGTVVGNLVSSNAGPADVNNAGGWSPCGTMAQSGNVNEWMETLFFGGGNDNPLGDRRVKGGGWRYHWTLDSDYSSNVSPEGAGYAIRIASAIPEAPGMWLLSHGLPPDTDLQQDHNGDGITLLTAYALNLDPHNPLPGMPVPVLDPTTMSMTFYGVAQRITYGAETSTDCQNWVTEGVTISCPDPADMRTVTVERDGGRRFLRLTFALGP